MKKRFIFAFLCVVMLLPFTLTACGRTKQDFSDEFEGFSESMRIHRTYSEMMDYYLSSKTEDGKAFHDTYSLSLCMIKITKILTDDESEKYLQDYERENPVLRGTYYEAQIINDYLTGSEKATDIIYTQLTVSTVIQNEGDPPRNIGETFVTLLFKLSEPNIYASYLGEDSTYDVYETNDGTMLYRRSISSPELAAIELSMTEDEKTKITSTKQNPARYGAKFKLNDFVSFILSDWKERGIIE